MCERGEVLFLITYLIGSKPPTNLVTKYGKLRNMIQKTQISCDKNTTRWNLNLCIPLFIRVSETATIEIDDYKKIRAIFLNTVSGFNPDTEIADAMYS